MPHYSLCPSFRNPKCPSQIISFLITMISTGFHSGNRCIYPLTVAWSEHLDLAIYIIGKQGTVHILWCGRILILKSVLSTAPDLDKDWLRYRMVIRGFISLCKAISKCFWQNLDLKDLCLLIRGSMTSKISSFIPQKINLLSVYHVVMSEANIQMNILPLRN